MTIAITRRTFAATATCTAILTSGLPAAARQSGGFDAAVSYSAERNGVSFLVMQSGRTVIEDYRDAGSPDAAWELASGTKSFSGIMAAALIGDGLLRLDERCSDTLPEWRADGRASITIAQLLSLTSGITGGTFGRVPTYADAISVRAEAAPGASFAYGPIPFQIFGEIVQRKLRAAGRTDPDPLAYLQARVFSPLGITPQRWRRDRDGNPHLPSGAALTARQWARFGQFVLDAARRTQRAGDPRLDHAALMACFRPTSANPGYGLTWWLPARGLIGPGRRSGVAEDMAGLNRLGRMWLAAGAGNQRLYLLPDRDLLIVRQANRILASSRQPWSDTTFMQMVMSQL